MNRSALRETLTSANVGRIRAYLLSKNWREESQLGQVASVWRRADAPEAELILPTSRAKDQLDRLTDLVEGLAEYEQREVSDVLLSFHYVQIDVIAVHVQHNDVQEGTIPLEDGVLLNLRARDMMASAAQATITKRRQFTGGRSQEATNYLSKLRLGQTRVGSYVVSVLAPIEDVTKEAQQDHDATTFTQEVTGTLTNALGALSGALGDYRSTQDLKVFDNVVERGVSANLCDALIDFSGTQKNRAFTLSISPARISPIDPVGTFDFYFTPSDVEALEQAAGYYRDNYVLPNKTILGPVKRLDRNPDADDGDITISATLSTGEKNVKVHLSGQDYIQAIHAHEGKLVVECHGDIYVSPRSARLLNPSGFKVIGNQDFFDDVE